MYYHGCAEVRLCKNFTFLNPLNSGQKVWWRMLFKAEQNVPKYTVNSCCLEAENHAYRVGVYTRSKFQDNVLVYNQWHWPLHLYLFFPLLWFVCLFFFFFTFPALFLFVGDTGQQIPFWQLSIDHNMDVCNDFHYPIRYRLYMPWTPSYNTHHKLLTQKLKFLWKFLTLTLHTLVLTQMCPSPSPVFSHVYFGALRPL